MTESIIHCVRYADSMLLLGLYRIAHVMDHASSVDPGLYMTSAILLYRVPDIQQLELHNRIRIKRQLGEWRENVWDSIYQLKKHTK
jgi:hypothetical protein